jgi:hypothetical protein
MFDPRTNETRTPLRSACSYPRKDRIGIPRRSYTQGQLICDQRLLALLSAGVQMIRHPVSNQATLTG